MKCGPWAKRSGCPRRYSCDIPSPGPGLGVRVVGEIKLETPALYFWEADAIFIQELFESGWYHKLWQAFAYFFPYEVLADG